MDLGGGPHEVSLIFHLARDSWHDTAVPPFGRSSPSCLGSDRSAILKLVRLITDLCGSGETPCPTSAPAATKNEMVSVRFDCAVQENCKVSIRGRFHTQVITSHPI